MRRYLRAVLGEIDKKNAEKKREKRLEKYSGGGYHIASTGEAMRSYAGWCKDHQIEIRTIMEIGANYAQDAEVLKEEFFVNDNAIWVFEAHPEICQAIEKIHRFNAYNCAVTNYNGMAKFHVCDIESVNTGISSLRVNSQYSTKEVEVPAIRMDKFIEEKGIQEIGFLKIDVEGCSWEVLDGFGDKIRIAKVIHVESEHLQSWEGEKLWDDIYDKLAQNGFEMMLFERKVTQSDSFWVRKDLVKI